MRTTDNLKAVGEIHLCIINKVWQKSPFFFYNVVRNYSIFITRGHPKPENVHNIPNKNMMK